MEQESIYAGLEAAVRRHLEARVINPEADITTTIALNAASWCMRLVADATSDIILKLDVKDPAAIERLKALKTFVHWTTETDWLDQYVGSIKLSKDVAKSVKYLSVILHKVLAIPFGTELDYAFVNNTTPTVIVPPSNESEPVVGIPTEALASVPATPAPPAAPIAPVAAPAARNQEQCTKSSQSKTGLMAGIAIAAVAIVGVVAWLLLRPAETDDDNHYPAYEPEVVTSSPYESDAVEVPEHFEGEDEGCDDADSEAVAAEVMADGYVDSRVDNGHDYVDLGLPSGLLWASCNLGASTPGELGDHFAWGETSDKYEYSQSSYRCSLGSSRLSEAYDAAAMRWGGTWRMPTSEEWQELETNCSWSWDGEGYYVKGRNGNRIYLPAAGYSKGSSRFKAGERGDYWSSSPCGADKAYEFVIKANGVHHIENDSRHYGASIRPVIE